MKVLVKHIHDQPPAPSQFVEGLAPEIDALVLDCLKKDREQRIGSTDELEERLSAISGSNPWHAGEWWEAHKPGKPKLDS